jgi:hypothetical protein
MVSNDRSDSRKRNGEKYVTTIDFRGLEMDIPRAQGPDGRDLGSAKWTVNGKVVWTTELHKAGDK